MAEGLRGGQLQRGYTEQRPWPGASGAAGPVLLARCGWRGV